MIKKVTKGDRVTLINTDKANEVIDEVNAARAIIISPSSAGSVTTTKANTIIELTGALGSLEEFTFVNNGGILETFRIPAEHVAFP